MRSLAILSAAALLALAAACAAQPAAGRPFWQTYGSTVPLPGGGCTWNINSDYFVPRHCDSGRYDLFSPCKTSHYRSPACASLHPVYDGYCTPFYGWHYKRKDHVYAKHCGCTPLKQVYGPWHLDQRRKGSGVLRPDPCLGNSEGCLVMADASPVEYGCAEFAGVDVLPNVEPFGGERLGYIAALPSGVAGGAGVALPVSAGQLNQALPPLTPGGNGRPFPIPGLFSN